MKPLNAEKEVVTRSARLPGDRGRVRLPGGRGRVRLLAVTVALDLLRRSLPAEQPAGG